MRESGSPGVALSASKAVITAEASAGWLITSAGL
jgi:hypothetical protein